MASVSRLLCRCLDPPTTSPVEPQGCKIIVGPVAWAQSMLDCHVVGEGARAWWRVCGVFSPIATHRLIYSCICRFTLNFFQSSNINWIGSWICSVTSRVRWRWWTVSMWSQVCGGFSMVDGRPVRVKVWAVKFCVIDLLDGQPEKFSEDSDYRRLPFLPTML